MNDASSSSSPPSLDTLNIDDYDDTELAEFCEYVIASLFDVNAPSVAQSSPITNINEYPNRQGIDTPPYTPPTSTTGAATTSAIPIKQPPVLVEFIVSCSFDPPATCRFCSD